MPLPCMFFHATSQGMDQTQELVARIKAMAEKQGKAPGTLSRELLGNGNRITELEAGTASITLATYSRACAMLDDMERAA